MNFKITPKRAGILIGGLVVASIISTLLDSQPLGLGIMVAVIWYIAKET